MNFIRRLSISARLGLGFGLVLLLLIFVTGLGLQRMAAINHALEEITRDNNQESKLVNTMAMQVQLIGSSVRDLIILIDEKEMKIVGETVQKLRSDYDVAEKKLGMMFDTMLSTSPQEKELFAQIKEAKKKATPLISKTIELGFDNEAEEAIKYWLTVVLDCSR